LHCNGNLNKDLTLVVRSNMLFTAAHKKDLEVASREWFHELFVKKVSRDRPRCRGQKL